MLETKYKRTDAGIIPIDWDARLISIAFSFIGNNTLAREQISEKGTVRNIHYGDILIKYGSILDLQRDNVPFIKDSIRLIAKNPLRDGDILMADTAEDETVGKCCEIRNICEEGVETGLHSFGLRPNEEYAPYFLGYAFNAAKYHDQLLPHIQGTKVSSISKAAVSKTYLCCPTSISEQRKIAKALTDIDGLLNSLTKLIEKKKNIKTATMQLLLTGKQRLPGFFLPWKECVLGNALEYEQPSAYIVTETNYCESGIPVLTAGKSFILGYTTETAGVYDKGDVIIFDDFTTDSKFVSFPFKAKSSAMKMLTAKSGYDLRFMFELLSTIDYSPSDHMRHWIGMFSNFTVLVPSLDEQTAIAFILSDMDKEISSLEAKRAKYESIKKGMMQELLTGHIRLV